MPKKIQNLKKESTLYIDTTDFDRLKYSLVFSGVQKEKKNIQKTFVVDRHSSHKILKHLKNFLQTAKVRSPQIEITAIVVNSGPGSYTGTRIGVVHAQALGFAWNILVKALEKDAFAKALQKYL